MRLHILFLLLIAVCHAEEHFDFLVDEEGYDCSTVKELTYRAQRDQMDLLYINKRISNFISELTTALNRANKVCNPQPAPNQALFLQTATKAKTRAPITSSSSSQIAFNSDRESEHPFVEGLSQSIEEIYFELENLSGPDADLSKCSDALNKGMDLLNKLNRMTEDITLYWLGKYLPQRFGDLTKLLTVCLKQNPITQTGNFSVEFEGTGHAFEQDSETLRTQEYDIIFDEPFYDNPYISAAIESFKLDSSQAGIRVNVIRPSTKGFTLQFIAPAHCKVYSVGVSWFATISLRSSIWTMATYFGPEIVAKAVEKDGMMAFQTKIDHPLRIKTPGVAVALTGFLFGKGTGPNIEVMVTDIDPSSFQLVIKFKKDSDLQEVGVTMLYYAQSLFQNQIQIPSSIDGPLNAGKGDREEVGVGNIVGQEFHNSYFWRGLSKIDMAQGHEFSIAQTLYASKEVLSVNFKTFGDTLVNNVRDTVFYSTGKGKIMETLTGMFNKVYWATGHVFEQKDQEERQESYHISFLEHFGVIPSVAVAIKGIDIDYYSPSVHIFAENVTEEGFDIRVVAPKSSRVYMVDISWIATVSNKSLIYVTNFNKNAVDDEELRKTGVETGERTYSIVIPYPSAITNPGIFVGIRGFEFGSSSNSRLDVSYGLPKNTHSIEVFVKTWADTKLYDFEITVLQYEKSSNQDTIMVTSDTTGPLYEGSGPRKEKIDTMLGLEDPIYFTGLNHIDFITDHNFRFSQTMTRQGSTLAIEFDTWADTKIWQVESTIFYTVELRTE